MRLFYRVLLILLAAVAGLSISPPIHTYRPIRHRSSCITWINGARQTARLITTRPKALK